MPSKFTAMRERAPSGDSNLCALPVSAPAVRASPHACRDAVEFLRWVGGAVRKQRYTRSRMHEGSAEEPRATEGLDRIEFETLISDVSG